MAGKEKGVGDMLDGECTIHKVCPDCGIPMPVKVCISCAGYYIGQFCDNCGPYSRLSLNYYESRCDAQDALDNDTWTRRQY